MLKHEANFTGSFDKDCEIKSVPQSLLALASMILNGPNIKSQELDDVSQKTVRMAQLLQYNSSIHQRGGSTGVYHSKVRGTALPIYVFMQRQGNLSY